MNVFEAKQFLESFDKIYTTNFHIFLERREDIIFVAEILKEHMKDKEWIETNKKYLRKKVL